MQDAGCRTKLSKSRTKAQVICVWPYAYLRHIFTELPKADTVEAIEAWIQGC